MRKLLSTLTILAASLLAISCSDDKMIDFEGLPGEARSFIEGHFTGLGSNDIRSIERDRDGTYDVKFVNGMEISFYNNGVWKEIDLNGQTLPNSIAMLLPENALNYIHSTSANASIEEIEKTGPYTQAGQGFKIELRGDRDIYFDAAGNVLRDREDIGRGKVAVDREELPAPTREFLATYFADQTPDRIEREWNKFEVVYNSERNNEAEVEFLTSDGAFLCVEVESGNEQVRTIIEGVTGHQAITSYLDQHHSGERIESFGVASGITLQNGYVVELDGKTDYKIYFDADGKQVKTIRD